MNLESKKLLVERALKVGKNRIKFVESRISEIKEAITKQDIKDLLNDGAIIISDRKGRKKVVKRARIRGPGKIKKRVNKRKRNYVVLTRKLRKYLLGLKTHKRINKEEEKDLRNRIRNKSFRSLSHMKEYVRQNINVGRSDK